MALPSWMILGLAFVCLCIVVPVRCETDSEVAGKPEEAIKRVGRSFGGSDDIPSFYDPRFKQMVDWSSVFNKRMAKRALGGEQSNNLGQASPNSPYFQDWSTSFGRNYRSFDNTIPNFGDGLRPNNMQNWQHFFGRFAKRLAGKRDFGNGGSPRLGEWGPSDLQNWRNFYDRGARDE